MESVELVQVLMYAVFGFALLTFEVRTPSCLQCQGKGQHRDDCPFKRD